MKELKLLSCDDQADKTFDKNYLEATSESHPILL